jgi:hypothetical protein
MTSYKIEEIQDSKDSGDDSASVGASQFHTSLKSPTRTPRLRQSTLLELFHPIE